MKGDRVWISDGMNIFTLRILTSVISNLLFKTVSNLSICGEDLMKNTDKFHIDIMNLRFF